MVGPGGRGPSPERTGELSVQPRRARAGGKELVMVDQQRSNQRRVLLLLLSFW